MAGAAEDVVDGEAEGAVEIAGTGLRGVEGGEESRACVPGCGWRGGRLGDVSTGETCARDEDDVGKWEGGTGEEGGACGTDGGETGLIPRDGVHLVDCNDESGDLWD